MVAVEAELLEGGHAELLVVVLLHRGEGGPQHLRRQGGDRFSGRIHPVDYSLKLFVCEGGAPIVLLNNPAQSKVG